MKLGDNFYNVNGIKNNEYIKTEVPKTRCILGSVYSGFQTNVQYDFWHTYEFCFSSMQNRYIAINSSNDGPDDSEIFCTNVEGPWRFYWDYMAENSSGYGFNRLSFDIPISSLYDPNNISDKYLFEASTDFNSKRKYIKVKNYGSSSWIIDTYKNAYQPYRTKTDKYYLFNRLVDHSRVSNIYYVKIIDKDKNMLGFYHFKQNGDSYGLYDEISKSFLNYYNYNGTIMDFHEYDTFHTDKYVDINPEITEYFEVDGTITEGNNTYERLVNNVTGITLKGIKI